MSEHATATPDTSVAARLENQPEHTRDAPVFVPRTDIYECGDYIHVVAEMPGVDGDSVDITLDKNQLTIHGKPVVKAPEGSLEIAEYDLGDYRRSFTLSNVVDREGIEATMKDGVLRLRLPKASEARARRIAVKNG